MGKSADSGSANIMIPKKFITVKRQSPFPNPYSEPDNASVEKIIKVSETADPSMKSLAYIRMTSRKGLFCFHGQNAQILFSKHPNIEDTYIIYPSSIDGAHIDILELSQILKRTGNKVQLIRVPLSLEQKWENFFGRPAEEESILDYKFPIHILDINFSLQMRGTRFLKFRNKLNGILKTNVYVQKTSFSPSDVSVMKKIVQSWAPLVFESDYDKNCDYILYAINYFQHLQNIEGLISYVEGKPSGFTIWEKPVAGSDVANSLIHCSLHERGLSEYLHHEMMKRIQQDGIKYLSLGGAETESLDAFKRKMYPILSVPLKTIRLA
jgi:hypothetical protein